MIPPEVKSASEVSPGGRTLVRDHRVEEGAEMPAHHVGGGAEGEVLVVGTRDHDHVGMRERGDDAVLRPERVLQRPLDVARFFVGEPRDQLGEALVG